MTRFITIPADVVALLYSGLQLEIGHNILPDLDELTLRPGREDHPEWFAEAFHRLDLARELMLVIDWPREHPVLDADVEIDHFGEMLLAGLRAELVGHRDFREREENSPDARWQAAHAASLIEGFLSDLREGRITPRPPARRLVTPRMVERAIVLQLNRNDHPERWCRAEIERELHDVEVLAVNHALDRLHNSGVLHLDGEHVTATPPVRYLDGLGMVNI